MHRKRSSKRLLRKPVSDSGSSLFETDGDARFHQIHESRKDLKNNIKTGREINPLTGAMITEEQPPLKVSVATQVEIAIKSSECQTTDIGESNRYQSSSINSRMSALLTTANEENERLRLQITDLKIGAEALQSSSSISRQQLSQAALRLSDVETELNKTKQKLSQAGWGRTKGISDKARALYDQTKLLAHTPGAESHLFEKLNTKLTEELKGSGVTPLPLDGSIAAAQKQFLEMIKTIVGRFIPLGDDDDDDDDDGGSCSRTPTPGFSIEIKQKSPSVPIPPVTVKSSLRNDSRRSQHFPSNCNTTVLVSGESVSGGSQFVSDSISTDNLQINIEPDNKNNSNEIIKHSDSTSSSSDDDNLILDGRRQSNNVMEEIIKIEVIDEKSVQPQTETEADTLKTVVPEVSKLASNRSPGYTSFRQQDREPLDSGEPRKSITTGGLLSQRSSHQYSSFRRVTGPTRRLNSTISSNSTTDTMTPQKSLNEMSDPTVVIPKPADIPSSDSIAEANKKTDKVTDVEPVEEQQDTQKNMLRNPPQRSKKKKKKTENIDFQVIPEINFTSAPSADVSQTTVKKVVTSLESIRKTEVKNDEPQSPVNVSKTSCLFESTDYHNNQHSPRNSSAGISFDNEQSSNNEQQYSNLIYGDQDFGYIKDLSTRHAASQGILVGLIEHFSVKAHEFDRSVTPSKSLPSNASDPDRMPASFLAEVRNIEVRFIEREEALIKRWWGHARTAHFEKCTVVKLYNQLVLQTRELHAVVIKQKGIVSSIVKHNSQLISELQRSSRKTLKSTNSNVCGSCRETLMVHVCQSAQQNLKKHQANLTSARECMLTKKTINTPVSEIMSGTPSLGSIINDEVKRFVKSKKMC